MSRLILIKIVVFLTLCNELSRAFECGIRKVIQKVADKEQPYSGQWPWFVDLYTKERRDGNYFRFCAATLINEWTLITVSHCFQKPYGTTEKVKASFGHFNYTYETEVHSTEINVADIILHENYMKEELAISDSDIAVLILEEAVKFSDHIQPICLPSTGENTSNQEGMTIGHSIAFQLNKMKDILYHMKLHSITPSKCKSIDRYADRILLQEITFCAESTSVPCNDNYFSADSGSPFMMQDEDTQQWKLFGIASVSYFEQCKSMGGVYTDITKFIDWISSNSELFTCNVSQKKIIMSKVCDENADCDDASDERHCVSGVKELLSKTFKFYISNDKAIDDENYGVKAAKDEKVEGFFVKNNKDVKFLPIGLGVKFPNVNSFIAQSCAVQKISFKNFLKLNKLKELNLGCNQIQLIEQNSFLSLKKLETLWLNNNQIPEIDEIALNFLINVNHLDLSFNLISLINVNAFMDLTKLAELSLKFNQLRSIPSKTFANNTKLKKIDLSFNEFDTINEDLFLNLRKLTLLDLSENKLTILQPKTFKDLTQLQVLVLNRNNLKILQSNFQLNNRNLEEIHLHDNKIIKLKPNIFDDLVKLRFVSLKDNSCIDKNFGNWLVSDFNGLQFYEEIKTCS